MRKQSCVYFSRHPPEAEDGEASKLPSPAPAKLSRQWHHIELEGL